MKGLLTAVGTWIFLLAVLAAAPARAEPAGDAGGPLRVGTAANYPPIVFKENGELKGVEVDLAAELERGLGVPLEFVEMPWVELYPALAEDRIDMVMAGVSITDKREAFVTFADPYMRVGQMALIRREDVGRLAAPEDMRLPGRRIGVEGNTTGDAWVREQLKEAERVVFASPASAVETLLQGKLDYVIHDAPTVWLLTLDRQYQKEGLIALYKPLTEEHLAWVVHKDDDALRQRLNGQLERLRASGKLQHILNKWIRVRVELKPK